MTRPVTSAQRFVRAHPCPVCQGYDQAERSKGVRCYGYLSSDGQYAHCTRSETAGSLPVTEGSDTYAHRLTGDCRCGQRHDAAPSSNGHRREVIGYEVRDAQGKLIAVHRRQDSPTGKTMWWERPGGDKGLGGMAVADLPLYGAELLGDLPDGTEVVVAEGEKAALALRDQGIPAVGTVTGAGGTPDDAALRPLVRLAPILWPDADTTGQGHMARIGARLADMGCQSTHWVEWSGAPPKGDAADAVAQRVDVLGLLDSARPWVAPGSNRHHPDDAPILQVVSLRDVQPQAVEWLWPQRLPQGKIVILAGDPGLGKSYMTLDIAARISLGGPWPDDGQAPQSDAILVSAEDGLADTIRPRLDLLGADVGRIHAIKLTVRQGDRDVAFSLQGHLPQVEDAIAQRHATLLVIDPLLAFTGKIDTHKSAEVRGLLAALAEVADRTGCTILAVIHLNKKDGQGNSLYRITASLDFAAAARAVFLVGKHPQDPDRRALAPIKCNLSALPPTLAYRFTPDGYFTWDGAVDLDANSLLAQPIKDREEDGRLAKAEDFLREILADGPIDFQIIRREAMAADVKERTLHRAKANLSIISERIGIPGQRGGPKSYWQLPDDQHCQVPGECEAGNVNGVGNVNTETPSSDESPAQLGLDMAEPINLAKDINIAKDSLSQDDGDVNPDADMEVAL